MKNIELKRLLVYLLLAFGLTWIIFFLFIGNGYTWDSAPETLKSFVGLAMLMPAVAHLLTRKLTQESFALTGPDSMLLGMDFHNRKWIFYILACILPVVCITFGDAIALLLCPALWDAAYYQTLGLEKSQLIFLPAYNTLSGILFSFAAFGEEFGWRAYMMPKLLKITSPLKALITGGIIWGLWHAPLTCIGHNFGMDYVGFPYLGILVMCINCILLGIILTFLAIKAESIWPAVFLHAVYNTHPDFLVGYVNPEHANGFWGAFAAPNIGLTMPLLLAALIFLKQIIACKKDRII